MTDHSAVTTKPIRYLPGPTIRLRFSPSTFAAFCKSRVDSKDESCYKNVSFGEGGSCQMPRPHWMPKLLNKPLICKVLQTWTGKISA